MLETRSLLLSLFTTFLALRVGRAQFTPCQVCSDGSTISLTDKNIALADYPSVNTCGDLQTILPLIAENSTQCSTLQSLESICGCSVPDNACQLCGSDNANLTNPTRELPFISFLFDGIIPTCEVYEAYLRSFNDTLNDCVFGQEFIADYCGCGGTELVQDEGKKSCSICPGGERIGDPDVNITIPGFPFRTCNELDQAVDYVVNADEQQCNLVQSVSSLCGCEGPPDPCTLCWDGSPVAYPDKNVEWATDLFLGIVPTCYLFEAYAAGLSSTDSTCEFSQSTGTHCGCPPQMQDHCVFCDGGFPKEYAQITPELYNQGRDIELTCELVESLQFTLRRRDGACLLGRKVSYQCGCNGGEYNYLGTDSEAKRIILVWLLRFSSLLSLLGAMAVQFDVLSSKERRRQTYNQLVFCMSLCDVVTALALLVGPLAVPAERMAFGTHGNNTTCTIQGYFIQLGLTSVFFNLSLAIYYKLTIVDGWKEGSFRQKRCLFFGLPPLVGVVLAFAGIPYYSSLPLFCYLQPLPLVDEYPEVLGFAVLPVMIGVVSLTSIIFYIYCKIREQQNKARKWRFDCVQERMTTPQNGDQTQPRSQARGNGTLQLAQRRQNRSKNKLVERTFGQAVAYIVAFFITWPILAVAEIFGGLAADKMPTSYWFWCVVVISAPLQGFNDAWIYFRPRIQRARRKARKQRKTEQRNTEQRNTEQRNTEQTGKKSQLFSFWQSLMRGHLHQGPVVESLGHAETSFSEGTTTSIKQRSNYEPSAALANDELLKNHIEVFLEQDDDDEWSSGIDEEEWEEKRSLETGSGVGANDMAYKGREDPSDTSRYQSGGLAPLPSLSRQRGEGIFGRGTL